MAAHAEIDVPASKDNLPCLKRLLCAHFDLHAGAPPLLGKRAAVGEPARDEKKKPPPPATIGSAPRRAGPRSGTTRRRAADVGGGPDRVDRAAAGAAGADGAKLLTGPADAVAPIPPGDSPASRSSPFTAAGGAVINYAAAALRARTSRWRRRPRRRPPAGAAHEPAST